MPNLRVEGFGYSNDLTLGAIVSLLITLSVAASLTAVQSTISQLKWQWYNNSGLKSRPLRDLDTLDSASRGLTGSIMLIWKLRLSPLAASFGALLVVVHLAIAPITQQSVQQISKEVNTTDNSDQATVATARMYNINGGQTSVKGMPPMYTYLGTGMKGAIPNGLFANATAGVDHVIPPCSSGNCTFNDYQSLGICSSVANVTSSGKRATNSDSGVGRFCILDKFCVTTDDLANITSAATWSQLYSDNLEQTGGVQVPLNFSSIAFAHQNNAATIADFYILYQNINQSAEHGDVFADVEFTLRWCVQTFSTKVVKSTAITIQHPDPNTNFTREGSFITNLVDGISFTVISQTHDSLQRYLWLLFSGATWEDAANAKWVQSAEAGVIASQFGVTSDPDLELVSQNCNRQWCVAHCASCNWCIAYIDMR